MEYVEEIASEIADRYRLNKTTVYMWKIKNAIPDQYFAVDADAIYNPDLSAFFPIPFYRHYLISRDARVYSKILKRLIPKNLYKGIWAVQARKGVSGKVQNTPLHRLLALAFIKNPYRQKFVGFKNNDKTDLRIENLQWVGKYNLLDVEEKTEELQSVSLPPLHEKKNSQYPYHTSKKRSLNLKKNGNLNL